MKNIKILVLFILAFLFSLFIVKSASAFGEDVKPISWGGGEFVIPINECLSEQHRAEIQKQIDKNIADLNKRGLPPLPTDNIVFFSWPMRAAANLQDFGYYAISNYVDHNTSSGLLDYFCGARTYNGHRGTDIFAWPFSWYKMDNNQVEIIAGAPGVIVFKNDGEFDRSCTNNSNMWNAIYIRQADNSIAWYGHLKRNSLTTKTVGQSVVEGEYLGVMGSSGNSTGPHLHFEVYDASNSLKDPWQGNCNSLNAQTWWAAQKPYVEPKINALKTHFRPPFFPNCPQQEILNEKNAFNPNDSLIVVAYYADQPANVAAQYSILRPDNSVWFNWSHFSNQYYNASYWYWTYTLPSNAQTGLWKFRAVFNSITYEKTFNVNPIGITPISGEIPLTFSVSQNYPNPFNPSSKFKVQISKLSVVKIIVYDAAGREVETLVNEELRPGTYEVDWDGSRFASGVYYYKLIAGDFVETKKMVLVK